LDRAVRNVFFFQAEDGIRDIGVTGVQTCALPISLEDPGCPAEDSCMVTALHERLVAALPQGRHLPEEVWDRRHRAVLRVAAAQADRKSVVEGKRVELGGRRVIKKQNTLNDRAYVA